MTYEQVLSRYGTQIALAKALGITQPTISAWGRTVPPRYQYQLEVISGGELRADRAEQSSEAA